MKNKIFIYDTTLRDGTQCEGVSLSVSAKLRLAEKMDSFGIDFIEGGWPGSNPRDMGFFEEAANLKLKHAKITAFGSTRRANIRAEEDHQVQLLIEANTEYVTIFGKTWLLHVTDVIKTTPEENLAMIKDTVGYLVSKGRKVIYDAEHFYDGYADNPEYAMKTVRAAVEGGACCVCLCDTNGGTMIEDLASMTARVVAEAGVPVGVHCHNDSELAVALSLAGVKAGATMVQGTLNGLGERNGNANLCSIIPNLILKLGYDLNCAPNLKSLRDLSLFLDEMANLRSNTRLPYVGSSSFAHKGGVHADAANKVKRSYEHIDPSLVGNKTRVLVSDMSGRASVMMKARDMGVSVDAKSPQLKAFLDELKELEYRGYEYEAANGSFALLLKKYLDKKDTEHFKVLGYRVIVERDEAARITRSEATVKLEINGEIEHTVAEAAGPVSALDNALRKALGDKYPQIKDMALTDFKVRIIDSQLGADAVTRVQIESKDKSGMWGTVGASDNIIVASWEALKDSFEFKLSRDE